jgi:hypothetical protein
MMLIGCDSRDIQPSEGGRRCPFVWRVPSDVGKAHETWNRASAVFHASAISVFVGKVAKVAFGRSQRGCSPL